MKHLKLFENNSQKKLYLCSIVNSDKFKINDGYSENFAFYNKKDRNNFLINYIHENFTEAGDNSIADIFDIDKLIEEYNE